MTFTTIFIFLIVLGVIVFIHELGHFSAAKFFGVKVDEFGIGFPPRIFGKKIGETEYTLNWIPLGGFVKIMGEDGENREDPRSFGSKQAWKRAIILSAGVIMNFVLAIAIFSFIFFAKFPQDITGIDENSLPSNLERVYVQINSVNQSSPAEKAGLEAMDIILSADGEKINKVEDFQKVTSENVGENILLEIQRGEENIEKDVYVEENSLGGGAVGISISSLAIAKYSLLGSIKEGVIYTANISEMIVLSFYILIKDLLFTGSTNMSVSGPVGIIDMTGQAAQMGILVLLNFTALISVNLGIINILPFPALDGGRIVFLLIEKIKGSPVSQELEGKIHSMGFTFLLLLMAVVTLHDIGNLGVWEKITSLL